MATLISTFAESDLKMRFREPFGTEGLNAKLAINTPPGTYRGFRLGTHGSSDSVTLVADPDELDHVAVYQTLTGYSLTIRTTGGDGVLDLSSLVDAAEKTWVLAVYATYSLGPATSAEIRAYELAPTDEFTVALELGELVVLGSVTIPAGGGVTIPASNITTAHRTQAWASVAKEALPWAPLLRNADFEWSDDDAGNETIEDASLYWTREVSGLNSWSTTAVADKGSRSIGFLYVSGTSTIEMYQHIHLPIIEGQTVRLKARKWVVSAPSAGNIEMFVETADADGTGVLVQTLPLDATTADGAFVTVEGSIQVPLGSGHTQITRIGIRTDGLSFGSAGIRVLVDSVQAWLEVKALDDLDIAASTQGVTAAHKLVLVDHSDPDQGTTPNVALLEYDSASNTVTMRSKSGEAPGLNAQLAVLGDTLADTPANADRARVTATAGVGVGVEYVLMWESVPTSEKGYRRYVTPTGSMIEVVNAKYSNTGNNWIKDVNGEEATRFEIGKDGIAFLWQVGSVNSWLDNAWTRRAWELGSSSVAELAVGMTPKPALRLFDEAGNTKLAFDHLGNRVIDRLEIYESWVGLLNDTPFSTSTGASGNGSIFAGFPTAGDPYKCRSIRINCATTGTASAHHTQLSAPSSSMQMEAPDNAVAMLQWWAWVDEVSTNNDMHIHMGIINSLAGDTHVGKFLKRETDTNWFVVVNGGSPVDTGIAPLVDVPQNFRVEAYNTASVLGGVARCVFYIDGVVVAILPITDYTDSENARPIFGLIPATIGGVSNGIAIGTVYCTMNSVTESVGDV
jgi:hypothetical protein